jgi:subtilisin family serine protease
MKKLFTLILTVSALCVYTFLPDAYAEPRAEYSPYKFIVKTKTGLPVSEATGRISVSTGIKSIDARNTKYKVTKIQPVFRLNNGDAELFNKLDMGKYYLFFLDEKSPASVKDIINDYASDNIVEFTELNFYGSAAGEKELVNKYEELKNVFLVPNDEMFGRQWYLSNDGTINPSRRGASKIGADINMLKAWGIETGSREVIVAILDSGVKDDHPDLRDRMWVNEREIPGNNSDDDNNGYIDDYKGWNFAYENNRPRDGFGHGTNIATVIGASTNNYTGFAGIDHNCRLMNLKNLSDDNYGEYSWWAESIKYAVDNGADVINMSEGGDDYSRTLKTAVDYANGKDVLIVAAMMNKGDNKDYYPASMNGVFAVGATDTDDNRCTRFSWGGGSCWGKHISVVAPGNKIYGLDYEDDQNYTVFWSGTSQSTAIVSGLSALLISQKPSRSSSEVKRIIKSTARDQVGDPKEDRSGWDQYYGYGRVDAFLALTYESTPEILSKIREIEKNYKDRNTTNPNNRNTYDDNTYDDEDDDGGAKSVKDRENNNYDKNGNSQVPGPSRGR